MHWQASVQDVTAHWSPSERCSVKCLSMKTKRRVNHFYSKSFSAATHSGLSLTKVTTAVLLGCPGRNWGPEPPSTASALSPVCELSLPSAVCWTNCSLCLIQNRRVRTARPEEPEWLPLDFKYLNLKPVTLKNVTPTKVEKPYLRL